MPSIRTAILMSVFFYAVYAVSSILFYALSAGGFRPEYPVEFLVKQAAAWVVTLLVARRIAKTGWSECFPLTSVTSRLVLPIVLASIGASIVLSDLASLIPMPESMQEFLRGLLDNSIPTFISFVIIAPVTEELFFRGWMFRGFLKNYTTRKSIVVTATVFALFHLNPWQAVLAFPLGIVYAWLVLKTGSLVPSILSHAVVNCTGRVAVLILERLGYSEDTLVEMTHFPLPMLVGSAVLLMLGGYWVYREVARQTARRQAA